MKICCIKEKLGKTKCKNKRDSLLRNSYEYILWCNNFRLMRHIFFIIFRLVIYVSRIKVHTLLTRSFSTRIKNKKVSNITRLYKPVCNPILPPFTNVQMHAFQNRIPLKRSINGFTIVRQNQSHTLLKTWFFSKDWLWIVNSRLGQQLC